MQQMGKIEDLSQAENLEIFRCLVMRQMINVWQEKVLREFGNDIAWKFLSLPGNFWKAVQIFS